MSDWYDAWIAEYNSRVNLWLIGMTDWVNYVGTVDATWASKINTFKGYTFSMFEHVKNLAWYLDQELEGLEAMTKEEIFDLWLERAGELTL